MFRAQGSGEGPDQSADGSRSCAVLRIFTFALFAERHHNYNLIKSAVL